MQFIYSTELSFFNIVSEHIDAFFPSGHWFKNFVAVEIGLLHSQPLTNGHFHFIMVESAPAPPPQLLL
jgi:hypothetical protein